VIDLCITQYMVISKRKSGGLRYLHALQTACGLVARRPETERQTGKKLLGRFFYVTVMDYVSTERGGHCQLIHCKHKLKIWTQFF
jgi:hypothetical protein